MRRANLLICGISLWLTGIQAQSYGKFTRTEYIEQYKKYAVEEMARTGIPASITLAQGILESGDGNSSLARKANNHFGIKCHDWTGKSIKHNDDSRRECFRKYNSAYESYRDHSDFLATKSRYAFLFEFDPTDYKQWAKGLKNAGYATSPTYARALIKIIEENKLYLLDTEVKAGKPAIYYAENKTRSVKTGERKIFENNRVKYLLTKNSDTFKSLTDEFDLLPWELAKYNELPPDFVLSEDQVLYIQPKRAKAEAGKNTHVVKEGETMYDISQKYAIKLEKLYRNNLLAEGTEPETGTELLLRGKKKGAMPVAITNSLKEEPSGEDKIIFELDPD